MIGFLIVAALLLALGATVMLWPLLRSSAAQGAGDDAIVALYRDKLRELEAEHASGAASEAQYEASRRELERQLLQAVAAAGAVPQGGPKRARWTAAFVGLFVVLAPLVLYVFLGAPAALIPGAMGESAAGQEAKGTPRPLDPAAVQKMIAELVDALKKKPDDRAGWIMLARAYSYQHQFPDAVRAYAQALALGPKDARLLADMAEAIAMGNDQRLDGEPMKLIERALQIDPREIKALSLAGSAAFDRQDYSQAVAYWERALQAAPGDADFAQALRAPLDEARRLAAEKGGGAPPSVAVAPAPAARAADGAAAGVSVRGKVALAANLAAKARPEDTIYVFARAAQGPKVPLALVRRKVKDLPFDFSLDDSMAMVADYTLSKYAPVIVGARISRNGDALPASGDLQGFSKPVAAGATGVQVTIDQVVP